jgi:hypothetical protein
MVVTGQIGSVHKHSVFISIRQTNLRIVNKNSLIYFVSNPTGHAHNGDRNYFKARKGAFIDSIDCHSDILDEQCQSCFITFDTFVFKGITLALEPHKGLPLLSFWINLLNFFFQLRPTSSLRLTPECFQCRPTRCNLDDGKILSLRIEFLRHGMAKE